jgi:hypothetical protein
MLDTLMKFGAYRVDYFEKQQQWNPNSFGFYIRAEVEDGIPYNRESKHQLYEGLDLIQNKLGMGNLVGIYLDVNCLKNLSRPAYQQMKQDIANGLFSRILILEEAAIFGCPGTEQDLLDLANHVGSIHVWIWDGNSIRSKIVEPILVEV